jgi:hypothetical protein
MYDISRLRVNFMALYLLIVGTVFRQRNGLPTSLGSIPGRDKGL